MVKESGEIALKAVCLGGQLFSYHLYTPRAYICSNFGFSLQLEPQSLQNVNTFQSHHHSHLIPVVVAG